MAQGISTDALKGELANKSQEDLVEMCKRLERSREGFTELLGQLQEDRVAIDAEKKRLDQTFEMLMRDMSRSRIGSISATRTPQLEEGPLNFVNRMWSKIAPRQQESVRATEHVGEHRKDQTAIDNRGERVTQDTLMKRRIEAVETKVTRALDGVKENLGNVKENRLTRSLTMVRTLTLT